jgi:hypothetical protein
MKNISQAGISSDPSDAYAIALAQERAAWQIVRGTLQASPQYGKALAEWRAAVDRIGAEAEELLRHPLKV